MFQLTIKSAVPVVEIIKASSIEGAMKRAAWLVNAMYNNRVGTPKWEVVEINK